MYGTKYDQFMGKAMAWLVDKVFPPLLMLMFAGMLVMLCTVSVIAARSWLLP